MSELNIGTELCARHRAIIRLEGSIEAGSVARLKTALMFAIAIRVTGLVIDMQKVEFIDSGGMCTLVDSFKAEFGSGSRIQARLAPDRLPLDLAQFPAQFDVGGSNLASTISFVLPLIRMITNSARCLPWHSRLRMERQRHRPGV